MGGAMIRCVRVLASVFGLLGRYMGCRAAQSGAKAGGTLGSTRRTPANHVILEEATIFAVRAMNGGCSII